MNNTIYTKSLKVNKKLFYSTNFTWKGKFIVEPGKPPINPVTGRFFNPSKNWINIISDVKELFYNISEGYPTSTHLSDENDNYIVHSEEEHTKGLPTGYRNAKNFVATNVAFVDLDKSPIEGEELSIEQSLENPFFKLYGTGYYTSPSYTEELKKHRLVFSLERMIDDEKDYHHLLLGLIDTFNSDAKCQDGARIFYGSVGCRYEIFDRCITNEAIDVLIATGRKIDKKDDIKARNFASSVKFEKYEGERTGIYLEWDKPLYLHDGNTIYLQEITKHTSGIFCPWHEHSLSGKGSEFIGVTQNGSHFFHCAKCYAEGKLPKSVWARPKNKQQDLSHFILKKKKNDSSFDDEAFELTEEQYTNAEVIETNERYLPNIPFRAGVTMVQAGKGQGKTEKLVTDIIKQAKGEITSINAETGEVEFTVGKKSQSLLVIGHRISLLKSMADRLGINFYLDKNLTDKDKQHYAICLNSLKQLELAKPYDIIVIDESEQVLQHLMSGTFSRKLRTEVTPIFYRLLRDAKKVICLDADLSSLTVNTIANARQTKNDKWTFVINHYTPQQKPTLQLYESKHNLIDDFVEAALDGQTVMFTSNSKRKVEELYTLLNGKCNVFMVTNSNSGTFDVEEFLEGLKNGKLDYKVLLFSPSVSTGVDIQTPFDAVYGMFEAQVITHFDFDQQIHRVRNTKETKVWIDPRHFNDEVNSEVIKQNVLKNDEHTKDLVQNSVENVQKDWYEWLLDLYCEVVAYGNASKNTLRDNFVDLKQSQGWSVELVYKTDDNQYEEELKVMRTFNKQEFINNVLNAPSIDAIEFYDLKCKKKKTQDEKYTCIRFEIENFFKELIDENPLLIEWWLDGRHYDILNYEFFIDNGELSRDKEEQKTTIVDRQHHTQRKALVRKALKMVRLLDSNDKLDVSRTISKDDCDIEYFSGWASTLSDAQQMVLGFKTVGKRVDKEPINVLKSFLNKIGMDTVCVRKTVVENGKRKPKFIHSLDVEKLNFIQRYTQLRQTSSTRV